MQDTYLPSVLVEIFHSFPRITLQFITDEDPKFSLHSTTYLHGLMFAGFLPIAALLLSLIGFLIYYNCVTFKEANPKEETSTLCYCSQFLIGLSMIITLSGVGAAVYGSVEVKNGIEFAAKTMVSTNQLLSSIANDLNKSNASAYKIEQNSKQLLTFSPDDENVNNMMEMSSNLKQVLVELPTQTKFGVEQFDWFIKAVLTGERYRSIITFSLIGAIGLVCLFASLGLLFHSKCCLVWTTVLGHVCLIVSYLYLAIIFIFGVAMSDLCVDPFSYIEKEAVGKLLLPNETFSYYMSCLTDNNLNLPYSRELNEAKDQLLGINGALDQAEKVIPESDRHLVNEIRSDSESLGKSLDYFKQSLDCEGFQNPLDEVVASLCFYVFDGLFIGLVSATCMCFALTVMLVAAPHVWKRYTREERTDVEEDWDFMDPMRQQPWGDNSRGHAEGHSRRTYSVYNPPGTRTMKVSRRAQDEDNRWNHPPPPYSIYK